MKKNYEYVLFDLDGTLVNSSEGITKAVRHALKYFNIDIKNQKELEVFIGPPLKDSFMKYYNLSEEDSILAIEKYREYYSVKGVNENSLYEGVEETLKILKNMGKKIILATSKPEKFSNEILKMNNILKYFDFVSGATMDGTRSKKEDVIKYAIDNLGIKDVSKCIMVGDKNIDVVGARKNNIDSILVTYGFATKEEIKEAKANYIIDSPNQLLEKV